MTHIDLFSGIGGFALAAEAVWPNIEHVFCEVDPFCQAILRKHWPNAHIHENIRTFTNTNDKQCDLLTGGFPCQPFSAAGKRKGTNDDRHLWPEMRRVIQEFSPHYVVAENVRGLLSIDGGMVFEQVCLDLEALNYEVQPFVIPACAVNAPHRRDRVWIVAHMPGWWERFSIKEGNRSWKPETTAGNGSCVATSEQRDEWAKSWVEVASRLCRLDDGLPEGVARPRGWRNAALKAYGNAIVPQVAEMIFRSLII